MKEAIIDIVLVAGIGCLTYGSYRIHPTAAWLVAGAALVVVGSIGVRSLAIDAGRKQHEETGR